MARRRHARLGNILATRTHRITNTVSEGRNARIQWNTDGTRGDRSREAFTMAFTFRYGSFDLAPVAPDQHPRRQVMKLKHNFQRALVSILVRGRKTWVVCGPRRGGNHAIINWIINGLENRPTLYSQIGEEHWLRISDSGQTVFLNDVTRVRGESYLSLLWKYRSQLRNAAHIIVSAEDDGHTFFTNWRVPFGYRRGIIVWRSVLNLLASRLKGLSMAAEQGQGVSYFTIDRRLLDALVSLQHAPKQSVTTVQFDDWCAKPPYRHQLLTTWGLHQDVLPGVNHDGGGSSFSGQTYVPSAPELLNRFRHVAVPGRVRSLLQEAAYHSLLSEEERLLLASQDSASDGSSGATRRM